MKKTLIMAVSVAIAAGCTADLNTEDIRITDYKDGKECAVSLTFDDSMKEHYTIVIVTHNMQQAVRISDQTAFFLLGDLVEYGNTEEMFSQPKDQRTEDYITGRFG